MSDPEEPKDDAPFWGYTRLLIRHPTIDPDEITQALGIAPSGTRRAGNVRRTPNGDPLPGTYRESSWSLTEKSNGTRAFFDDVVRVLDLLEPKAAFLLGLVETGGSMSLIVDLPDVSIGDALAWEELSRLTALKIDLGVEVFSDD